jgi:hypothetical protein
MHDDMISMMTIMTTIIMMRACAGRTVSEGPGGGATSKGHSNRSGGTSRRHGWSKHSSRVPAMRRGDRNERVINPNPDSSPPRSDSTPNLVDNIGFKASFSVNPPPGRYVCMYACEWGCMNGRVSDLYGAMMDEV